MKGICIELEVRERGKISELSRRKIGGKEEKAVTEMKMERNEPAFRTLPFAFWRSFKTDTRQMKPLDGTFIVITRDHLPVFGTIADAVRINGLALVHLICVIRDGINVKSVVKRMVAPPHNCISIPSRQTHTTSE